VPSEGEGQGIAEASGLAGWIAPQTLRHDFTPARPAKQGQRQAPRQPSPRRALPLWKPPPWHPPPSSELPKGEGSLAQNVVSAVGGRVLRGADPPRALRVTALANLCPCFAPVCPQRGRPGSKGVSKERTLCGSVLHASASLQRQALVLARSRSLQRDARLAPSHPPARRARESASASRRHTLPRSHPP
jgi:hypothetical protein